jgi:hypothetical protein
MNLVVVYTTAFNTMDAVLEFLKSKGCDAVALESPDCESVRMPADPWRHTIRDFVNPLAYIAVPTEQESRARTALKNFTISSYKRVAAFCETMLFQTLVASLITLVVAVLLYFENPFDIYFPILYAVWLGAFIFVANLSRVNAMLTSQRLFRMWRRPPEN